MSKLKRPKKLRRPNVPLTDSAGGSVESAAEVRPSASVRTENAAFDYTYIRKDLTRIATLAAGFVVVLVALSFFLK